MHIFVQKNGQQTGPFHIDQIHRGLAEGFYHPDDLAWYEGARTWVQLSSVPGIGVNPPLMADHRLTTKTLPLAIWSLVLGILGIFTLGLTSIPAIICGHLARRGIKRSDGTRSGEGLVITGLMTGYFGFIILGIALCVGFATSVLIRKMNTKWHVEAKVIQKQARNNARKIDLELSKFDSECGLFPTTCTAVAIAKKQESHHQGKLFQCTIRPVDSKRYRA
jgi:hypothetical protein